MYDGLTTVIDCDCAFKKIIDRSGRFGFKYYAINDGIITGGDFFKDSLKCSSTTNFLTEYLGQWTSVYREDDYVV